MSLAYTDFIPNIEPSQQEKYIQDTINGVSDNQIDWKDFMKFANFQMKGADDYYWGQPVLGQEVFNDPAYQVFSVVNSFIFPWMQAAIDLAQFITSTKVEEYVNAMKQPSEEQLLAMFGKYSLYKAGGWWDKSGVTKKFLNEAREQYVSKYKDLKAELEAGQKNVAQAKIILGDMKVSLDELKQAVANVISSENTAAFSWAYAVNPYDEGSGEFGYGSYGYTRTDLSTQNEEIASREKDITDYSGEIAAQEVINTTNQNTLNAPVVEPQPNQPKSYNDMTALERNQQAQAARSQQTAPTCTIL
jgi:hypothetical protein